MDSLSAPAPPCLHRCNDPGGESAREAGEAEVHRHVLTRSLYNGVVLGRDVGIGHGAPSGGAIPTPFIEVPCVWDIVSHVVEMSLIIMSLES